MGTMVRLSTVVLLSIGTYEKFNNNLLLLG